MIKQIIYISIIVTSLHSKESIYPYPITFDESGLVVNGITLFKSEKNQYSLTVSFLNNKDKYLHIHNDIVNTVSCKITQANEINKNTLEPWCQQLIKYFYDTKIKEIKSNYLKIIIYGSDKEYRAIVFKNNHYLISFSSNMDLINFVNFLKSVKEQDKQKQKQKLDFYLDSFHLHYKKGEINRAFQYLVSAYIIDDTDKRLEDLYRKLFDLIIAKKQLLKRNLFFQTR